MAIQYIQVLPSDEMSGALFVEDPEIFYIHEGKAFNTSISLTIANGATAYVLLVTNAAPNDVHLRDYVLEVSSAPVTMIFYENATVSANGTAQSIINLNRTSTNTSTCAIYSGPTVTDAGTQLVKNYINGNKQDGGFGRSAASKEILLAPSKNYLWAITNSAGGNADVVFRPFWIEP